MVETSRAFVLNLFLTALAAATVLVSVVQPAWAAGDNPHGVAVIIGNRDYQNKRVPAVAYAHRDAEAFRRYVLDVLGFDPNRVFDVRDATQAQLFTWFGNRDSHEGRLWRYLHPRYGSDVVVFYSGHGVPGLKDRRGYLLPADAEPDTPEINGYPIDLLYANLGKLREAKTVRVFLDACFSGDSDRGMLVRSASPVFVQASLPEATDGKLTVLSAASGSEVASWDERARHGIFTHHLLDALYGEGDLDGDGQVTAREAKAYLDDTMTIAARVEFGRYQNASLNGRSGAVLARAGSGGEFPPRPTLGKDEAGTVGGAKTEALTSVLVETAESVEAALDLTFEQRLLVQLGLSSLGPDVGRVDGIFGTRTRSAISAIQREKGFTETGHLTAELAEALVALGKAARAERRRAAEVRPTAKPTRKVGEKFQDCAECPEMVVVPSGSYEMGSPSREKGRDADEGPVHRVTIERPFGVGVYEVTFSDWAACRRDGGCSRNFGDRGWGRGDRPVIDVRWADAQEYVRWLSRKSGKRYRLLSESEWEYAARAGTGTRYSWGQDIGVNRANCRNEECGDGFRHTAPVGSFRANQWGVHDMLGNVYEWTEDCWNANYFGAPGDGSAWLSGNCDGLRVIRGGAWFSHGPALRVTNRSKCGRDAPRCDYSAIGFRVAKTLD
ncbi:MAG: SUMF1/EgtB/PvdO family nonheme iron enzyme [Immundisolibacterales bacterium]|nr:SUMF1/EgtB/PvdO family nonheme iron enzyme [Immundisolibacterales bacterium]